MPTVNTRTALTAELFMAEWRRAASSRQRGGGTLAHHFTTECGPVAWLMPDLLRLAREMTDAPTDRFESAIRRLLSEQLFVEGHGDATASEDHDQIIEQCVHVMLRILRDAKADAPEHDAHYAAPQMFG